MMKILVSCVIGLLLGIVGAVAFIYFGGSLPLRFDNPALTTLNINKPQVVGFLPYWLLDKADKPYEQYITTLTYFGLSLSSDGTIQKLTNPQEEEPGWTTLKGDAYTKRLADGKKANLKQSLLIISGDDAIIHDVLQDPVASANNLMGDVAPIMKDKGFTDLNLDIESFMAASPSGQAAFTQFVKTVKDALVAQKLGTLSLDLIPISLVKPMLYDAKALGALADSIVLMTYDYHYTGSFTAGAIAPIGGAGTTVEYDVETAVKEALKYIPKEKILLGVPLYGYEWETIDSATESATIPGGSATASTRRVAEILATCTDCTRGIDPVSREPYVIYPEGDYYNELYYEDESSMKEKIALAQKYNLGGVALWALGYEDDTMLKPLMTYKNSISLSW